VKRIVLSVLALCFAALTAYSGWRVWAAYSDYRAEAEMHGAVMEYKPREDEIVNQSVIDLQAKYPDALGWLTVPGTKIDYPFVQSKDNDYYLRRDLNGDYALAGTLFMDYRCEKDFTSQNTIIYGHHMKNGSMFGTLKAFNDKAFFGENRYGTIYLPNETLTLEFFAYMVVKSTDREIYSIEPGESYLGYVSQNARQYRDIGLATGDRIVCLSTCSYEFDNARMVLLARAA
jgi:sortase B